MQLPRYFLVGDRPVRFVATPGGGMDVQAFDWATGHFARDMGYLTRCCQGGGEIDEVEATEFDQRVARLRADLAARSGGQPC
ncbi:MAG: hypothetical protein HY902_16765 [Deltaproteobacteria bacterium]|nr:hypothetical protein [Deltaproteobacteria bacterium]